MTESIRRSSIEPRYSRSEARSTRRSASSNNSRVALSSDPLGRTSLTTSDLFGRLGKRGEEIRHLDRRLGGFEPLVPHLPSGALGRLLRRVGRKHPEGYRHAGPYGRLADAARRVGRDVVEVWRLSSDDRA